MRDKERFCDVCGNTCNVASRGFRNPGSIIANELALLEARWGYCSGKDQSHYKCIICEDCFDEVVFFIEHVMKGKVPHAIYNIATGESKFDIVEDEDDDTESLLESEEAEGEV